MKKELIFASSTPRSGGTLLTNIISLHPDVLMTKDLIHFFRYIYKKYNPIQKKKNLHKLFEEFCLRLRFRNKIIINPKTFIKKFDTLEINYKNILIEISNYILKKNHKIYFGENANSEWHNISNFLELDKSFIAFQGIRDPRAVLSSWKNVTYEPNKRYLIMIFYWLDAIKSLEKNLKKYKQRFSYVRFEDIHNSPKKTIKQLYRFLGIDFKDSYLEKKKFKKQIKNSFIDTNVSAYSNKKVIGFSRKRTSSWVKKISNWEIALIQHFLGTYMKKYGYKILKVNKSDLIYGLNQIKNDKILNKYYVNYKKTGNGTHDKLSDPTSPKSWSATDYSKNIKLKFKDTPDYKKYIYALEKIKQKINKL